jgi:hypothetical protein
MRRVKVDFLLINSHPVRCWGHCGLPGCEGRAWSRICWGGSWDVHSYKASPTPLCLSFHILDLLGKLLFPPLAHRFGDSAGRHGRYGRERSVKLLHNQ